MGSVIPSLAHAAETSREAGGDGKPAFSLRECRKSRELHHVCTERQSPASGSLAAVVLDGHYAVCLGSRNVGTGPHIMEKAAAVLKQGGAQFAEREEHVAVENPATV
jgi:hypothetical protein